MHAKLCHTLFAVSFVCCSVVAQQSVFTFALAQLPPYGQLAHPPQLFEERLSQQPFLPFFLRYIANAIVQDTSKTANTKTIISIALILFLFRPFGLFGFFRLFDIGGN